MTAKLAFIAAHACDHAIRLLCRVLGVSRSWFHARQGTAADRAARAARHDALIDEIRSIFEDSRQRYGAPRIHAELRDRDHRGSYARIWVTRPDQAARVSVSRAATPSVNVTPSMTCGNWFAPFRRRHVFAAA